MNVEMYFSMFFSFATEMIIAMLILIPQRLNFRKYLYIRIPVSVLAIYGTSIGLYFLTANVVKWSVGWNIALYTIFIVVIIAAFYNVYAFKLKEMAIMIIMAYSVQHIIYQLNNLLLAGWLNGVVYGAFAPEDYGIARGITTAMQIILYILVFLGVYFLLAKPFSKVYKYSFSSRFMIVLAVSLYLIIVVDNAYLSNYGWMDWLKPLKTVLNATFLLLCLLYQLYIIWGFRVGELAKDKKLLEYTLQAKLDEYIKDERNIAFINMKCHDLRKQIRALKTRKGELSDEDFAILEESLRFYDTGVRTGNHTIDTLIQEKQLYCRSKNIEFTALIDGSVFADMAFSDVYFLFLNIIDNAIEATEAIEDESLRVISLTAKQEQGVILIEETNYFQGERRLSKEGKLLTTKKDGEHHGYGTQSIGYIVKKYKGKISFDINGNIFDLKIAI